MFTLVAFGYTQPSQIQNATKKNKYKNVEPLYRYLDNKIYGK